MRYSVLGNRLNIEWCSFFVVICDGSKNSVMLNKSASDFVVELPWLYYIDLTGTA